MNWLKLLSAQRPGDRQNSGTGQLARSIYEQDFDRIVFSYPFRCLQDKTQVFPLPKTDFVHTRLTHSLEVASVGRSLGKISGQVIIDRESSLKKERYTGADIGAIVASAALAHDIGNPPFGHSGEDAISEFFLEMKPRLIPHLSDHQLSDLLNYEGNAEGFRLLTRGKYQGLNLTYATLAAFSKYPRQSLFTDRDPGRRSQKKYGFFQSEKDLFIETARETGMKIYKHDSAWIRHPLAFLVEAADDICYSVIDLEDGCNLGLVSVNEAKDLLAPIIGERFNLKKFNSIRLDREKIGLLRAMTIAELIDQASEVFLDHEEHLLTGSFDISLTEEMKASPFLNEIIRLSIRKIYRSTPVLEKEAAGFEVLSGLLQSFISAILDQYESGKDLRKKNATIINLFPQDLKLILDDPTTDLYARILACLDYVVLMTDSVALDTYRKIKGISLPGF